MRCLQFTGPRYCSGSYQAFLILSAVVMSTAGVLLLIFNQTFGAILTGIGIVALAGIEVNSNIVLIDTFNCLRKENPGMNVVDAIVKTDAQRCLLLTRQIRCVRVS